MWAHACVSQPAERKVSAWYEAFKKTLKHLQTAEAAGLRVKYLSIVIDNKGRGHCKSIEAYKA